MKQSEFFIGIDVSKATLDVAVVIQGKQVFYQRIENHPRAICKLIKTLRHNSCPDLSKTVFCMEHTGVYNNHLLKVLHEQQLTIWMESAMHIKRSMGVQRGKNDKVDAKRIALFAYKNRDEVKIWQPPREQLQSLKQLFNIRKQLIKTRASLKKPFEASAYLSPDQQRILKNSYKTTLKAMDKDLKNLDIEIDRVIREDEQLKRLFMLVTSVKGIGRVSAIQMIVATNEFKTIKDAKKFACFAGVAPFEHISGTSVLGRAHVSNIADKSIKCALHMAALAAISHDGELQDYFFRKVEEGKNKMSVVNAVRNKLIHRVFACVRDNRLYKMTA